jgi:hypothetical protein
VSLHNEDVRTAHGFTEAATHFTVGELNEIVAADFDVEMLGHLLSECRMGATRIESEALSGDLFHVKSRVSVRLDGDGIYPTGAV